MISTPWSLRPCLGLPIALGVLLLAASAGTAGSREVPERWLAKPVSVVLASPQGDVEHLESIEVVFSKPMVAAKERGRTKKPWPLVIDPPIRGTVSWIGSRALSFVPQPDVPAGTHLTCRIPQGTQSLDGDGLVSDYVWEIVVGRPRLLGSLPNDHGLIAPDARIHLLFDHALGPDAEASVRLAGPAGEIPIGRVAPDSTAARQLLGRRPTAGQLEAILALQPLVDLEMDENYRIEIDVEIPFAAASVGLHEAQQITFRNSGPPRIESVEADTDAIILHLTAPIDPGTLRAYLELDPAVPDLIVGSNTPSELHLGGDFRESTTYSLRLRPGLPSLAGAVLETEERATITTPRLRPRLAIVPSHGVLQKQTDATIRIEGTNLDTVMVFAAWVPADSVPARLVTGAESWRTIPLAPVALWHAPRQAPDSIHTIEIPLERFGKPPGKARGLQIRGRARSLYQQPRGRKVLHTEALIQITDLGVSTFAGSRRGLAWVTSLSTGKALEGAEVLLHALGANEPLWSGTSLTDGLAWLPGISELPVDADTPLLLEVRTSDDAVWLRLDTDRLSDGSPYRGYLATDRSFYRSGETVRWIVFAREVGSEGIDPIDLAEIGYRITAARSGRQIGRGSLELTPPGNGTGSFAIGKDELPGLYRISLTIEPDGSGEPFANRIFSITTDSDDPDLGSSPFATAAIRTPEFGAVLKDRDRCRSMELTCDRRCYSPSDTARVTLSPSMDQSEALVLMFDSDIRRVHRLSSLEGPVTLPIPLTDASPPEVSIQALLVGPGTIPPGSPEDQPLPSYACGKTDLRIDSAPWRLDVDVATEREIYEPGEDVTLHITVRDAQGNPAPGTATIAVVEEAAFDTFPAFGFDPLAAIFSSRGPGVLYSDTRNPLRGLQPKRRDGPAHYEVGGGMPKRIGPQRIGATVHWEAFEPIGPDGRATIRLAPTAEKPYCRVRVLVCSGADRFGYGESIFEIRKSLKLECTAPRFVHEGDEIEIRATVHSRLHKKVKVEIEADAEGATIDGKRRTKVKVKPGESGRTRFRLIDQSMEGITLRIRARSKEHRDSIEVTIPVRRDVVWDRSFLSGTVDPSIRTVIEIPDGILPEIGGLTTIVSPSVLGGLEETITSVIDRPHRSLEEAASSLLAIATRARLFEHFNLPDTTEGFDAATRAAVAAEAILDYVGAREIHAWPSVQSPPARDSVIAYALFAVAQASERGYPIPRHLLNRLGRETEIRLHRLMQGVRRDGSTQPPPRQSTWLLWALSEAERLPAAGAFGARARDAELLFSKRAQLPITSRTALGLALANLRHRDDAVGLRKSWLTLSSVLAQEIKDSGLERSGRNAWISLPGAAKRGINDSDVLSTALFLRFLSLHDPGDENLPGMILWVLNQRRPTTGSWWNARTTAWTLHLLVSTVSGIEGPSSEISGEIALGGKFESFHFRGRDHRGDHRFTPMHYLAGPERVAASHQLRVETDGRRSVYFTASVKQARSALETPAREEGLILDRIYLDTDGRHYEKGIPLGHRLFVHATVVIPQDAKTLFIEDHLPAGITWPERREDWKIESDLDIVHHEFGDDGIRIYAENVHAGSYHIRYPAIAVTAGEYRVPGARASLLENTEIYAISSPISVRIKDRR